MTAAVLRAELGKSLSTRTPLGFLIGGTAFAALNAVIVAAASGPLQSLPEKREAITVLPVLVLAFGVVGAAGEHRHRTAAPAVLAARRGRSVMLAGRMAAYALVGLGLGAVALAAAVGVGVPLLADDPGPGLQARDLSDVVVANLVACVLSAILGAAVGALLRSQVVGVVTVFVLNFAVVPMIASSHEGLANLTPFGASSVLTGMTHDTTLNVAQGGWVLAGWTAALAVVALVAESRRDLA